MDWDEPTACARINSLGSTRPGLLVAPCALSKLWCFVIFWPKIPFLQCFNFRISASPLWPHLPPITYFQPPVLIVSIQTRHPPFPPVFAIAVLSCWNALLPGVSKAAVPWACWCIRSTTLSAISLPLFYFSPWPSSLLICYVFIFFITHLSLSLYWNVRSMRAGVVSGFALLQQTIQILLNTEGNAPLFSNPH